MLKTNKWNEIALCGRSYEKKSPNEADEKKFYEELRKKAEKSFDWSKEKNPKKIAEIVAVCIADVKRILKHNRLVSSLLDKYILMLSSYYQTCEYCQSIVRVDGLWVQKIAV